MRISVLKSVRHRLGQLRYIILLSLLICAVGYWSLQTNIIGLYHDDGVYVVTARSLSEGAGYRIVSLPGSPPQTKYPILYSYILSWVWSACPAFPENIAILKSVNLVFLFFIVLIAYRFYCTVIPESGWDGYLYAALAGANPGIFSFADFAVSDLLFVLLVLLACWLYGNNDSLWFHGWRAAGLALIGAAAVLTRSAGVPLAVAGLVHFLWARRFRELAIYSVTLALALLPWVAWRIGHQTHVSQASLLAYYVQYDIHNTAFYLIGSRPIQGGEMIWANLRYLFDSLDVIWLLPVFPQLRLRLLVLTLLAVGIYPSIRKRSVFLIAFLFLYLLLILGWPFSPIRYALPLVPLLLLFVFRGIHTLQDTAGRILRGAEKWPLKLLPRVPVYFMLCLNMAWLVSTVQPSNDRWVRGAYGQRLDYSWEGFLETFDWIRSNTPKEAVLATAYDPMYNLYTGRKAIMPTFHKPETYFYPYQAARPDVGSVEAIKGEFRRLRVRYVVTNPLDQYREGKAVEKVLAGLLASYAPPSHLVFTSGDGKHKVYEIPQVE
ncbi:MAG: hypothetical protein ACM3TN_24700 [Alphaproteobacteria bacterium]